MRFLTVAETIRRNAARHEAKGLWYVEQGMDGHARGSFRKAVRNHHRADELMLPELSDILKESRRLMSKMIADNIMGTK